MAILIGTNIFSLQAQWSLSSAADRLATTFERLSSGQRINRARDDAAGLAIAGKLNTDSRIYSQAIRNVNDGMSYLNIADGVLNELSNITSRQRELAEEVANGVYTYSQRKAITSEANALVREFNRIVQSTGFNGRAVLDLAPSSGELRVQAGYGLSGSIAFGVGDELARSVGTGTFIPQATYWLENSSIASLTAADIDGDGALDMVSAGYVASLGSGVAVWFNNGDGSFRSAVSYRAGPMGAQPTSRAVEVVDVDGDGALDLVTANYTQSAATTGVLFNDGHGNFGGLVTYEAQHNGSYALCVTDVNGDGAPDLVSTGEDTQVRLNDGRGTFGSAVTYSNPGASARGLSVADINGDGAADLVTAGSNGGTGPVAVRLNDGLGGFGAAVTYSAESTNSNTLFLADVNGDGAPDLITAGSNGGTGRASVRLNDGQGLFGAAVSYSTEIGGSSSLFVTDLNGDGAVDLVTAASFGANTVRLNDGHGNFEIPNSITMPASTDSLSIADINGDGAPDLLTAGASQVSVVTAVAHAVTTIATLDLFSQSAAREALKTLQAQLDRISSERGAIGSFQSRLSVALNTLSVNRENADAAAARIIDADIAHESAELVRNQILQQAGSAVLAQANQQPALAIRLLANR